MFILYSILMHYFTEELSEFVSECEDNQLTGEVGPIAVIMLLGSSGTGKTFLTEIIADNFPIKVKQVGFK